MLKKKVTSAFAICVIKTNSLKTNYKEVLSFPFFNQALKTHLLILLAFVGNIIFPETEIRKGTMNFSQENKLGEGGCGEVFKGTLAGIQVAVKRLSRDSLSNVSHIRAEISALSRFLSSS